MNNELESVAVANTLQLEGARRSRHIPVSRQSASKFPSIRRIAIFGHIARLGEEVTAHQALRAHVDLSLGRLPDRDWKRRPGRPNNGSIRFVPTPAACPRRYGDQPSLVAMA